MKPISKKRNKEMVMLLENASIALLALSKGYKKVGWDCASEAMETRANDCIRTTEYFKTK